MSRYISPENLKRFETLETRQTIRKSRPSRKAYTPKDHRPGFNTVNL